MHPSEPCWDVIKKEHDRHGLMEMVLLLARHAKTARLALLLEQAKQSNYLTRLQLKVLQRL